MVLQFCGLELQLVEALGDALVSGVPNEAIEQMAAAEKRRMEEKNAREKALKEEKAKKKKIKEERARKAKAAIAEKERIKREKMYGKG